MNFHPQAQWIKVYAEELFDNANTMANFANEAIAEAEQDDAIAAYMASAAFEFSFFEDALACDAPESYLKME